MPPPREERPSNDSSLFVLSLFWITILFQTTELKYIWGMEGVSAIVNLFALSVLLVTSMKTIFLGTYNERIWYFYIIPGSLVLFGMLSNIAVNAIFDSTVISYFGVVLPWAAFLAIPVLMRQNSVDTNQLWRHFFWFMVIACLLALAEYFLLVISGGTYYHVITTPSGTFLAGRVSLFHMVDDGTPHARLYACFGEPGALAMLLLPAIAYAFVHRHHIALIIFLAALYFTGSLGGIIGVLMLFMALSFQHAFRARKMHFLIITVAMSAIVISTASDYLVEQYEARGESSAQREIAARSTLTNLPSILVNQPLGFTLGKTLSDNPNYFGTVFTPGSALMFGGMAAFFGYLLCLVVSLACALTLFVRRDLTREERMISVSLLALLPFIAQRTAIWDSALFAFLFSTSIIRILRSEHRAPSRTPPVIGN